MSFSEWREVKLGDIAEVLSGYAFKTKDFVETGVPVVKIKNIIPPIVDIKDAQYVSEELYREKVKYSLNYNDILISMTGSHINQLASAVGKIGRVKLIDQKLLLNQRVGKLYVKDSNTCNEDYLYYLLTQDNIRYELATSAGGSANQANISPQNIRDIVIILPPIEEQKAIANILSSLDEKIELNNQMNKTLEEMAQALFKRWFVDFEFPNEDGKPYKSSDGEMVDSELGMIPKGWISTNIGEVSLDANTGADAIRRAPIVEYDTGIRCARVGDLSNKRGVEGWGYCEVSDVDYEKFRLRKGDILVTRTGTIGLNTFINEDLVAVFNNGLIRLRINKDVSPLFIYQLLNQSEYYNYISKITGETSTRPNMKINYLLRYKFVLPHEYNIINKFIEMVGPLYARINLNQKEIMTLKNARDTLLPKLMSGEIRVTDLQN